MRFVEVFNFILLSSVTLVSIALLIIIMYGYVIPELRAYGMQIPDLPFTASTGSILAWIIAAILLLILATWAVTTLVEGSES